MNQDPLRIRIFDRNLQNGFKVLSDLSKLRGRISREGASTIVGIIGALIASGKTDEVSIHTELSGLMGFDLTCFTTDMLRAFAGEDPSRHFWYELADGQYALHPPQHLRGPDEPKVPGSPASEPIMIE